MELNKINRLVFEALESIASIETSRVSMFDIEDKYRYWPFFRFKFENKKKEDEIYKKIKDAIDSFEGNLKWNLVTRVEGENFLILPIISAPEENNIDLNDKENFISLYGENSYRKKIDDCIDDIPKLAKVIGRCR